MMVRSDVNVECRLRCGPRRWLLRIYPSWDWSLSRFAIKVARHLFVT